MIKLSGIIKGSVAKNPYFSLVLVFDMEKSDIKMKGGFFATEPHFLYFPEYQERCHIVPTMLYLKDEYKPKNQKYCPYYRAR